MLTSVGVTPVAVIVTVRDSDGVGVGVADGEFGAGALPEPLQATVRPATRSTQAERTSHRSDLAHGERTTSEVIR